MEQCNQRPSKKQKVYKLCKNAVALIITVVALVPIVYLLGSDDAIYPSRPLFAAYAEDAYFQTKVTQIEAALNSSLIVNLYWLGDKKENSVREWQHLQEFARFLGHRLNNQQVTTVNRLIVPPEVKSQKKGKSGPSAESLRLVEQAYSLANSGEMNTLRNKLNKVGLNTINRLKIKQKDTKNAGLAQVFKSRIIDEVLAPKVWIITIHPDNWQYHNSEQLKKQLLALGKEREKDRFVVVSTAPADTEWKRMKAIPINIDDNIFSNLKGKLKQVIKAAFPFEVNTTRVIESVLCHHESSLYHLNDFIQNCNNIQSCINSINFLSKKNKKGEDAQAMQLLNELCNIGHIDQENAEFQAVLDSLGFFDDYERAQENIKLYFGVATGKKCKGSKQCNFEWLNTKPSPSPNTPKTPKSQKVSSQKPQKQSPKKEATKQKLPAKQKSQTKPKAQKQIKKQEPKQAIKADKVKQGKTGKSKQKVKKVKQQTSQIQGLKTLTEEDITSQLKQPNIQKTIQQEAALQTTQTEIVQQKSEDNDEKTSNIPAEAQKIAGQAQQTEEVLTDPIQTDSSTAIATSEPESQCEKKENCEVVESSESQKQAASPEVLQIPQKDQPEPVQIQSDQAPIVTTDETGGQVSDDTIADYAQVVQTEVQKEGQDSNQAQQPESPQAEDSNPDNSNEGQQTVQQTLLVEEQSAEVLQPLVESIPTESETILLQSEEASPEQA